MFQGHVEEVAGAAGGVEHPHIGQAHLEGGDDPDGLRIFALFVQGKGGAVDRRPFLPQGLDDGGQDQALDIGPRGVVGAELVALLGVEGPFEQGAEDGGLHMAPVGLAGVDEQVDLSLVERQRRGRRKEPTVEAQDGAAQDQGERTAGIHVPPKTLGERDELGGVVAHGAQQVGEAGSLEQAHVLGKQGEEAADQEGGGQLRGVAGLFQGDGQARQALGDVAGDPGGAAAGVEREGVEPDGPQPGADLWVAQVTQADAVGARVRVGDVGTAAAAEFAVELDAAAHVHHHDEGRAALVGGQGADILHRLAMGAQHGLVPAAGVQGQAGLLAFEHVAGAAVEVDEALALRAVAVLEDHAALEAVAVVFAIAPGRVGLGQAEQGAEFRQEDLVVGPLGAVGAFPAGDEGVDGLGTGVAGIGVGVVGVYGAGSGGGWRVAGMLRGGGMGDKALGTLHPAVPHLELLAKMPSTTPKRGKLSRLYVGGRIGGPKRSCRSRV